jgi:HEPN domain-containing protein
MSPAEDAALLLAIVRRHLRTLELGLSASYPDEDWGFTAQQAVEKLLKALIVLAEQHPPRSHDLRELSELAGLELSESVLDLQVFAVEARYEEGPFALPASKVVLLEQIQQLLRHCEQQLTQPFTPQ